MSDSVVAMIDTFWPASLITNEITHSCEDSHEDSITMIGWSHVCSAAKLEKIFV